MVPSVCAAACSTIWGRMPGVRPFHFGPQRRVARGYVGWLEGGPGGCSCARQPNANQCCLPACLAACLPQQPNRITNQPLRLQTSTLQPDAAPVFLPTLSPYPYTYVQTSAGWCFGRGQVMDFVVRDDTSVLPTPRAGCRKWSERLDHQGYRRIVPSPGSGDGAG